MGPPVVPPIDIDSVTDWDSFGVILNSSGFATESASQWGSNYVGPVEFGKSSGNYVGYFNWCPGKKVSWDYDPTTGIVVVTSSVASCGNVAARVQDEESQEFLIHAIDESPSGIVDELSTARIVNFDATRQGTKYEIEFTFRPDSGGADYTKTAKAVRSNGQFGSISVI